EITFPPVTRDHNFSAPVIIKAMIFGRQVNRVYMDRESSCEVIYEHCFLKLKPSIKASKVTQRTETFNFAIVRSNSSHNLLLERTEMQKMGIVVSTIHGAIKFYTTQEIGTVFSTYEPNKVSKVLKKIKEASLANVQMILICTNAEERVVVNNKHPKQTVIIRKLLLENFKEKLQDLLKSNIDIFA
nr:hypothetical protein [Tanacetum cinerariifolium]